MNDTSRRKFLAAAAAGAGAVAGTVGLPIARAGAAAAVHDKLAHEPVVAWIENPDSDELVLMAGEREVVVRDRDLVTRILVATGAK